MYLALYRKYRPQSFDDVISQPHITATLKNQIKNGKTAHAYLFTGSRGTGKTSCAKIFSMAVNCLSPRDGNPCMECESCREIASGAATDIVEMDAASNSSVDDVRMLRDELAYTPVSCKYRVYIIDEVHAISPAAFNALLKTLEEPPAHVIFILATTELHKVPATILSRCQRFEFRRIAAADSAERLMYVAQREGVELSQDAAELIARLSDGGMRDALSLLDRCAAAGRSITAELVRSCAGAADNRHLFRFAEMTAQKDVSGCIRLLDELHAASKDIAGMIDGLSSHYRDLMLYKTVPADKGLLNALPDEYPEIERISGMYSLSEILRCLTLLQQCADSIGRSKQRKTLAEMCFVKMCLDPPAESASSGVRHIAAPATQSGPMGSEYAPVPDDKLSPRNAAIVHKINEIGSQAVQRAQKNSAPAAAADIRPPEQQPRGGESAPPQPPQSSGAPAQAADEPAPLPKKPIEPAPAENEPFSPLPERDSIPAPAPDEEFAPPMPEEPPEEFIPPRETEPVTRQPAKAPPEEKAESKPEKPAAPEPEKPLSITQEQWDEAVTRLSGMLSSMLEDSTVSVGENGVLEISSGNLLLHNQVKERGCAEIEQELSAVLGQSVRVALASPAREEKPPEETPAVIKLLEKAKQLNIEVQYK